MKEKEFKLVDILLPYQRQFVESPKKKKLWLAGRQLGKSTAIAFELCHKVLQRPGAIGLCISTGARAASELLKKCKLMAEAVKLVSHGQITYTDNAESITFSNGSRILSLPSNPEALRGFTASIVCLDEAAFIPFVDECWQAILPTLTRDKDAELVVCSTPAGMQGLFYDLYTNADDTWHVQTVTIEDAVAQGLRVDLEELKKTVQDPDVWSQEYMCRWSKSYGAFLDTSLVDYYDTLPSEPGEWYLGMDVGRKHDKTALTLLYATSKATYLDNIITLSQCEYSQQVQVVKDLDAKHHFRAGFVDEGGIGSALAEQVTKTISSRIRGLAFTAANKTPMFEAIRAGVLDHRLLVKRDLQKLVEHDFQGVSRIVTEDGKVRFAASRDDEGHSDVTSSLALGLEALRTSPLALGTPQSHIPFSAFGGRMSRLR